MNACWERRRRSQRAWLQIRRVLKDPTRLEVIHWGDDNVVAIGAEHPCFEVVKEVQP
jgi:hypothetical protein